MRKPNRLIKYDYSHPGYYFVTICTLNKAEYFGKIENGRMVLNSLGRVAEEIWHRNGLVYPNVNLDEFVIMPNHMHAILIIRDAPGLRTNLSQIIGSYKNVVSKDIRNKLNNNFAWQPSFYDHVIRNDGSLDKIREYIKNNPLKWELDRNNPDDLWM